MREWPLKMIHYLTGLLSLSTLHCALAALVVNGDKRTFIYSLIYLPVVILLSTAQKRTKYSWQFLILTGAAIGLVYFVSSNVFDRKTGVILVMLAAASYFYARSEKKKCWLEEPSYPFLVVYILMILLEMKYKSVLLRNYAIYGTGVYYLLCMYKNNLDEMQKIFDVDARLERFPSKRLFQSNDVMMGFQTIVVVLGMLTASAVRIEGALSGFVQMIRRGISGLLRGLESEELVRGEEAAKEGMQMAAVHVNDTSRFMEILLAIGEFLGWIIVIGFTLYVFFRILKAFYRLYLAFDVNRVENGDHIEMLYVAGSKDGKKRLGKQKRETIFWNRTPNSKIRKVYKKRVLKEWKDVPGAALTPMEIEEKVLMSEKEKQVFHFLYEKARYGKDRCTKEEAAEYKF